MNLLRFSFWIVVNSFFQLWVKFRYHFLLRYKHILVLSQIRQAQLLLVKLSFPFPIDAEKFLGVEVWGRACSGRWGSGPSLCSLEIWAPAGPSLLFCFLIYKIREPDTLDLQVSSFLLWVFSCVLLKIRSILYPVLEDSLWLHCVNIVWGAQSNFPVKTAHPAVGSTGFLLLHYGVQGTQLGNTDKARSTVLNRCGNPP